MTGRRLNWQSQFPTGRIRVGCEQAHCRSWKPTPFAANDVITFLFSSKSNCSPIETYHPEQFTRHTGKEKETQYQEQFHLRQTTHPALPSYVDVEFFHLRQTVPSLVDVELRSGR